MTRTFLGTRGEMDSTRRSIAKTLSWRFCATIITALVVYVTTRRFTIAVEIGLADTTIKLGAYFYHERMWNKIKYGRHDPRPPRDYEI